MPKKKKPAKAASPKAKSTPKSAPTSKPAPKPKSAVNPPEKPRTKTAGAIPIEALSKPFPRPDSNSKPQPRAITHEMIALRAYEIWQRKSISQQSNSQHQNWIDAETEILGGN
jgi:hypothetical protein